MFHRKHNNRTTVASNAPASHPLQQSTVEAPPILQEAVRYDTVTEVQPVIHRQVDQIHVHHVEKHIMGQPAPYVGGSFERPPLVQEHVNHRHITEVHPVYHAPSYQVQDSVQTVNGPILPQQQYAQQQYAQQFAPQYATQFAPVGAYVPRAAHVQQQYAPKVKHHIFHRS